jgi:hypothetical protein
LICSKALHDIRLISFLLGYRELEEETETSGLRFLWVPNSGELKGTFFIEPQTEKHHALFHWLRCKHHFAVARGLSTRDLFFHTRHIDDSSRRKH